jgi:two-component system, NtrC family, sensor histidine kinase PilS
MERKDEVQRRSELVLLSLFRVFQASVLAVLLLISNSILPQIPGISMRLCGLLYLLVAFLLWWAAKKSNLKITTQVLVGAAVDLVIGAIALRFFGGVASGAGALMLITIAITASLLTPRLAALTAASAALVAVGEAVYTSYFLEDQQRNLLQTGFYGLSFFIVTTLIYWLGTRTQASRALAEQRGQDLLSLAEVNELVIQRIRTGVLVVDHVGEVQRYNESAWYLLGMPSPRERHLSRFAQPLLARMREWQFEQRHNGEALAIANGVPAVVPRFAKIGTDTNPLVIIFLEDETQLSKRAEELTLTSLGRLSASIAHEVRNPLGAISNAAQLLQDSAELSLLDRQLTDIIVGQCKRMNGIVENVLQLSRRERSRPEDVSLNWWVEQFAREFRDSLPSGGGDRIRTSCERGDIRALVDPSQLTQACWNLVRNAYHYGHKPDQLPDVLIRVSRPKEELGALVEIIDKGPGIPEKLRKNLFEPFFTTRPDGTGLGLYICKELLEANQASIDYLPGPAGGACFRIRLTEPFKKMD